MNDGSNIKDESIKPYPCFICGKTFSRHSFYLNHHLSVHNNSPPKQPVSHQFINSSNIKLAELEDLTLEELQLLNNDDIYLDDFVQDLDPVKKLNDELDILMANVESLAIENMSRKEQLKEYMIRIAEKQSQFKILGNIYDNLNLKYQEKSNEFTPNHIKELLQISVSISDTDCEKFVEEFLTGKINVQTFVTCYMNAKKLSQMRKAKEERLTIQLNALERAAYLTN